MLDSLSAINNVCSIGKLRGLQALAGRHGVFTVAALDHRDVFVAELASGLGRRPSWEDVVEAKLQIARALAPHASAVMLDPIYSAAPAVLSGAVPPSTPYVVALERSGYLQDVAGRLTELEPNWSVRAIKLMGATAVKLLLHYHPDVGVSAQQEELVARVSADCLRYDITFLLEPICYAPNSHDLDGRGHRAAILGTVERLAPLGPDVLKLQCPTAGDRENSDDELTRHCLEVTATCNGLPWVVLSGGASYETFLRQVEIACSAGATGFVAGRAIWSEALSFSSAAERGDFLSSVALPRLAAITKAAIASATPLALTMNTAGVGELEDWHTVYQRSHVG
jgi:tagatose 1,6-diphosphate aldolase